MQSDVNKYPTSIVFLPKEMKKDGTRSHRVLTAFSLRVREISYEYHKYHFLTKGNDISCFLVAQVVVGKKMYERNRP